ncbi:hypothetical protein J6590_067015 [Homalodisca vitripennis]|nr:hypothetical protein J6590_067015 [Homalodisca vitripennis]
MLPHSTDGNVATLDSLSLIQGAGSYCVPAVQCHKTVTGMSTICPFANQCAPALIHLRYQLCSDNCPTNHRPAPPRHSACRHSVTTGTAQRLQF